MSTEESSLSDELYAFLEEASNEPWAQGFFEFLRELETFCPDRPRVGESKNYEDDLAFLSQALYLEHAPAAIRSIQPSPNLKGPGPRVQLEGYFLGLLGPSGPLPLCWTEYIWARSNGVPHPDRISPARRGVSLNRRDSSLRDFLNIFNHRFLTFFYRAWSSSRKTVDYDRPDEARFMSFIGSFLGLESETLRQRLKFDPRQAIYFSGHFAQQSRYPSGLEAVVADYLNCDVELEENVGKWIDVPEDQCTVLGQSRGMGSLGQGVMTGARFWDCQLSFQLRIGPVPLEIYEKFVVEDRVATPGQDSLLPALRDMVALYTHRELFCSATVVLDRNDVPPPTLGGGSRLGFSTWLHSATPDRDPADLTVELC